MGQITHQDESIILSEYQKHHYHHHHPHPSADNKTPISSSSIDRPPPVSKGHTSSSAAINSLFSGKSAARDAAYLQKTLLTKPSLKINTNASAGPDPPQRVSSPLPVQLSPRGQQNHVDADDEDPELETDADPGITLLDPLRPLSHPHQIHPSQANRISLALDRILDQHLRTSPISVPPCMFNQPGADDDHHPDPGPFSTPKSPVQLSPSVVEMQEQEQDQAESRVHEELFKALSVSSASPVSPTVSPLLLSLCALTPACPPRSPSVSLSSLDMMSDQDASARSSLVLSRPVSIISSSFSEEQHLSDCELAPVSPCNANDRRESAQEIELDRHQVVPFTDLNYQDVLFIQHLLVSASAPTPAITSAPLSSSRPSARSSNKSSSSHIFSPLSKHRLTSGSSGGTPSVPPSTVRPPAPLQTSPHLSRHTSSSTTFSSLGPDPHSSLSSNGDSQFMTRHSHKPVGQRTTSLRAGHGIRQQSAAKTPNGGPPHSKLSANSTSSVFSDAKMPPELSSSADSSHQLNPLSPCLSASPDLSSFPLTPPPQAHQQSHKELESGQRTITQSSWRIPSPVIPFAGNGAEKVSESPPIEELDLRSPEDSPKDNMEMSTKPEQLDCTAVLSSPFNLNPFYQSGPRENEILQDFVSASPKPEELSFQAPVRMRATPIDREQRNRVANTILFKNVEAQAVAANAALGKSLRDDHDGHKPKSSLDLKKLRLKKKSIKMIEIGSPILLSASANFDKILHQDPTKKDRINGTMTKQASGWDQNSRQTNISNDFTQNNTTAELRKLTGNNATMISKGGTPPEDGGRISGGGFMKKHRKKTLDGNNEMKSPLQIVTTDKADTSVVQPHGPTSWFHHPKTELDPVNALRLDRANKDCSPDQLTISLQSPTAKGLATFRRLIIKPLKTSQKGKAMGPDQTVTEPIKADETGWSAPEAAIEVARKQIGSDQIWYNSESSASIDTAEKDVRTEGVSEELMKRLMSDLGLPDELAEQGVGLGGLGEDVAEEEDLKVDNGAEIIEGQDQVVAHDRDSEAGSGPATVEGRNGKAEQGNEIQTWQGDAQVNGGNFEEAQVIAEDPISQAQEEEEEDYSEYGAASILDFYGADDGDEAGEEASDVPDLEVEEARLRREKDEIMKMVRELHKSSTRFSRLRRSGLSIDGDEEEVWKMILDD